MSDRARRSCAACQRRAATVDRAASAYQRLVPCVRLPVAEATSANSTNEGRQLRISNASVSRRGEGKHRLVLLERRDRASCSVGYADGLTDYRVRPHSLTGDTAGLASWTLRNSLLMVENLAACSPTVASDSGPLQAPRSRRSSSHFGCPAPARCRPSSTTGPNGRTVDLLRGTKPATPPSSKRRCHAPKVTAETTKRPAHRGRRSASFVPSIWTHTDRTPCTENVRSPVALTNRVSLCPFQSSSIYVGAYVRNSKGLPSVEHRPVEMDAECVSTDLAMPETG